MPTLHKTIPLTFPDLSQLLPSDLRPAVTLFTLYKPLSPFLHKNSLLEIPTTTRLLNSSCCLQLLIIDGPGVWVVEYFIGLVECNGDIFAVL